MKELKEKVINGLKEAISNKDQKLVQSLTILLDTILRNEKA